MSRMGRRTLPALLALVALSSDLAGGHGLALATLLLAIPAAFVLVLDCYADALAARCGGVRPLLAAGSLALLVASAALRSPAVVGGVPRVAVSALAVAFLLALLAAGAGVVGRAAARAAPPSAEPAPRERRIAA